uniref:Uncharacterized protein n=1 Tax=Mycena chlorophos TaxID=658473 RepID=A0ABQ0KWZ5_MYCCL|nr:predicted protein [Mycena chlorophos]
MSSRACNSASSPESASATAPNASNCLPVVANITVAFAERHTVTLVPRHRLGCIVGTRCTSPTPAPARLDIFAGSAIITPFPIRQFRLIVDISRRGHSGLGLYRTGWLYHAIRFDDNRDDGVGAVVGSRLRIVSRFWLEIEIQRKVLNGLARVLCAILGVI